VVGYWQGRGAAELGLAGEVTGEQFEAMGQGLHPATGERLRPRHSADRLSMDGEIQSRGRHLYDFTLSAPKSVSIVAALGEDDRLVQAHQQAVEAAVQELEASAAARVRIEGANENRRTGNLVLAVYHHDTSRELDPQLHTHAVAGNLTYDGTEGRWKALQASDIYAQRAYLTEVYRNTLAHEVRALGTTSTTGTMRGVVTWGLRFEASPRTWSTGSVSAVSSGIRRSRRSPRRGAAARLTTKWPSSSEKPDRTS
jgi:conjugative relaxase-like TrwC/TraI family protein